MHGYQHTALNMAFFAPLAAVGLALDQTVSVVAFGAGYLVGTLWITPDLDLRWNDAARRWGPLRFIWTPYHLFSRHRGMSHTYLLGPLTRLLYLGAWIALALALAGVLKRGDNTWAVPAGTWLLAGQVTAGYFLSQWLHLMADGIWPLMKQRRRPS